jgi:aspartokinase/homoserine dehydrogenase 1
LGDSRAWLPFPTAGIATQTFSDFVVGHGEIWSADLFAAVCRKEGGDALMMDARDVLVVSETEVGETRFGSSKRE